MLEGRKPPRSMPTILNGVSFAEALSIINFLAHYQYRLFNRTLFSPASLDNLTVSHYYTQAWQALKRWPNGFHVLLGQYIDNPMSTLGKSGINKHFRDIREKLHRQRENKGIARLRAAFDQFIEINWPNAIQTSRLTRISLSSEERPLITLKEAQCLLNCRAPRINSLISQGKITLHKFKGQAYFNREEIESLAKLYESNWSMEQAVAKTELSRYQLKLLLDAGLIKALQKADHQNRDWLICKTSWEKQIRKFQKTSTTSTLLQDKTLSEIQKQGLAISDLFNLLKARQINYNFTPSSDKPISFKQSTNFKLQDMT